jgi:hypothetical protein
VTILSKKKPGRAADDDAKFEAFLKKQFAELRAELDSQMAHGSAKAGKVVDLKSAREKRAAGASVLGYFDKWKYGIAAAVIVAVAVPMVLQLNRQRTELANQTAAPAPEQGQQSGKTLQDRIADREETDADATRHSGEIQANKNSNGQKTKTAPAKDAREAGISDDVKGRRDKLEESPRAPTELAASRSEGYVTKEEARSTERAKSQAAPASPPSGGESAMASSEKAERSVAAGAPAPAAPGASPAPAPVFAAKKRSAAPMAETEAKRDAASMANADEAPAAKPRSFSLDDTNAKLKKQSLAEEEKAEMEKLWKEYEKDPKAFNKDANRSARLRTLLARHDTRSRAKRMMTK